MQNLNFDDADLVSTLGQITDQELDGLSFGVIAFDAEGVVRRYNRFESEAAGLSLDRVIGNGLFTTVAPCMNNFMVAQRFVDATDGNTGLDATLDYVLTLRMRPIKVRLRLLAEPGTSMRYVLVHRAA